MLNFKKLCWLFLFFNIGFCHARVFDLIPDDNLPLPMEIVPGATAFAIYEVHNISDNPVSGGGVIDLPKGVTQVVQNGYCGNSTFPGAQPEWFDLPVNGFCLLKLQIVANDIGPPGSVIFGGPVVCSVAEGAGCNTPDEGDELHIIVIPATSGPCLSVSPAASNQIPGGTFVWTITNTSGTDAALQVTGNFDGLTPYLDSASIIYESCDSIAPLGSCTARATVDNNTSSPVGPFNIQFTGTNTNPSCGTATAGIVISEGLDISPSSFTFTTPNQTQVVTIENNNPQTVILDSLVLNGLVGVNYINNCATIAPFSSCTIDVSTPVSGNSYGTGSLIINYHVVDSHNNPGPTQSAAIEIDVLKPNITITADMLDVDGSILVSPPQVTQVTVTNTGPFNALNVYASYEDPIIDVTMDNNGCENATLSSSSGSCSLEFSASSIPSIPVLTGSLFITGTNLEQPNVSLGINAKPIKISGQVNVAVGAACLSQTLHLQYQPVCISNLSSTSAVNINNVTLSAALENYVTWCEETDTSCVYTSEHNCGSIGATIPASGNCVMWFKGNEGLDIDGNHAGSIAIEFTAPGNPTPATVTFNGSQNTQLYIGGNFTGGNNNGVLSWNGNSYSALGTGLGGSSIAYGLTLFKGDLYTGGDFQNAGGVSNASFIASWNGNTWNKLSNNPPDGAVFALSANANSVLYLGGRFSNIGGSAGQSIGSWDGTNLTPLQANATTYQIGAGGFVNALSYNASNNLLYVGGVFSSTVPAAMGGIATNVVYWDGVNWNALANGTTTLGGNAVYALVGQTDITYVGGTFNGVISPGPVVAIVYNYAIWSQSSASWNNTLLPKQGFSNSVFTLTEGINRYAGGMFTTLGDVVTTAKLAAVWNAESDTWQGIGTNSNLSNQPGSSIRVLYPYNNVLYAGGQFADSNVPNAQTLATYDETNDKWLALNGTGGPPYPYTVFSLVAAPSLSLSQ